MHKPESALENETYTSLGLWDTNGLNDQGQKIAPWFN